MSQQINESVHEWPQCLEFYTSLQNIKITTSSLLLPNPVQIVQGKGQFLCKHLYRRFLHKQLILTQNYTRKKSLESQFYLSYTDTEQSQHSPLLVNMASIYTSFIHAKLSYQPSYKIIHSPSIYIWDMFAPLLAEHTCI